MSLNVGDRLGHYDVTALLGEGGMGQVYRATDTQLHRDVALKILPDAFAADPERLARFQREAQVLASLNHPGIAAIYGIEEAEGTRALVLELVEGPTLADRIAKGPIPVDEALPIAKQIAEALEAAHEAGVIHRDLKPANIKVRDDGTVKVLDFGLAKALDPTPAGDPSQSPTLTAAATQMGVIMGTAAYMSPEQARGKPVDKKVDIWAFGCVLYEMLTGRRAFEGEDVTETIARVVEREPDWTRVAIDTPRGVQRVLRRCLTKRPQDRLQHVGDVRLELVDVLTAPEESEPTIESGAVAGRPTAWQVVRSPMGVALMLSLVAALLAATIPLGNDAPATNAVPERITSFSTVAGSPVVSPNGQLLAFIASEPHGSDAQIWIKSLPDGPPQQLTRTPGAKAFPAFSPDGSRIAYTVLGDEWQWDTWVVPIVGGEPRLMMRDANSLRWMSGGDLIFSEFKQGSQLAIVMSDESGADRRDVWVPALNQMAHQSAVSPEGQSVVIGYMGLGPLSPDSFACFVRPLATDGADQIRVIGGGDVSCSMFARWSLDGQWIYFVSVGGEIWREPAAGGRAERVFGGVELDLYASQFALAPDGRSLIFAAGQGQSNVWHVARSGRETQLTFNGDTYGPRFSNDGSAVYFVAARRGQVGAVWQYRVEDGRRERVCTGLTATELAVSPDGRFLLLVTLPDDGSQQIWVCAVDGGAPPRPLLDVDASQRSPKFSPDGSTVYFAAGDPRGGKIWRVGLDGSDARPISEEITSFGLASVSPDGEWLSVSHREESPRETWLYPTSGKGEPRFLMRGWSLRWTPGNRTFMFNSIGMISTTWVLENPDGVMIPPDLPAHPTGEWFERVGARRVSSGESFSTPSVADALRDRGVPH